MVNTMSDENSIGAVFDGDVSDERFKAPVDYKGALIKLVVDLNRLALNPNLVNPKVDLYQYSYAVGVAQLEKMLLPYFDADYDVFLNKKKIKRSKFDTALDKFGELMLLASRRGFFPSSMVALRAGENESDNSADAK